MVSWLCAGSPHACVYLKRCNHKAREDYQIQFILQDGQMKKLKLVLCAAYELFDDELVALFMAFLWSMN